MTVFVITAVMAAALCAVSAFRGILIAKQEKDPQQAVVFFLEALKRSDYAAADSCLSGYSGLGIGEEAATAEGQQLLSALRRSYDYSLSGECDRRQITACQKILLTRLDIRTLHSDAMNQAGTDYASSLAVALEFPEQYTTSDILDIHLEYTDKEWKIIPDEALITALRGGL